MFNQNIITIANSIFMYLIILATIIFAFRLRYIAMGFKKMKPLPKSNIQKKFCVLIPARNESNVIDRLLKSLKEQNYSTDKYDVYVIVEDENDETIKITQSYGYTPFVRKNLKLKGKGYALDECLKNILEQKNDYDILTIIDADNILAPNYLEEFNNAFCYGYSAGKAYHRQLNQTGNWIADCSTLTFAGINTFQNKGRTMLGRNIIMSGSGLYIDFDLIHKFNGWPFTTLTEDYELSLWCTINNVKTAYIPTTYYYDEQPTTLHMSRKQRVRWIKGYFQARKKYSRELKQKTLNNDGNITSKLEATLGVIPNILYIASIIIYQLFNIVMTIYLAINQNMLYLVVLKNFCMVLVITYIILQMYTLLQIQAEKDNINYTVKSRIKLLIMNPFYICLYIPFAIEALVSRKVEWTPIKHGEAQLSEEIDNNSSPNSQEEVTTHE